MGNAESGDEPRDDHLGLAGAIATGTLKIL
jgi:hypothetical protein